MLTVLRGNIVSAPALGELEITELGYLAAEDGKILGIYPVLPEEYAAAPVEDWGDALILQSFADLHLHAPQYPMMATGMDLPLLDWLEAYAFPTESRCADEGYARALYRKLARDLVKNGTTRVCIFSSLHRPATLILMEELERAGIHGFAGKVNMDRNGGKDLQESTEESMRETLRWLEECRNFRSIHPMLTPRFTPSCTDELMAFLGRLARERGLPVQSHLSENRAEMDLVGRLHPDCRQYWETYAKFGLWKEGTLMAHCVHSDRRERDAMREAGVTAVHCAASNNALCSGIAPVRVMLDEGVKVALGSDVAGGDSLSLFDGTAMTLRVSKDRRILDNWETEALTVPEAWYLATSAGAEYFCDAPGFAVGNPLHAMVLDDSALPGAGELSVRQRFERCVYHRQENAIRAVWSAGRRVYSAEED